MGDLEETIEILREVRSDMRLMKYFSASIIAILLVIIITKIFSS